MAETQSRKTEIRVLSLLGIIALIVAAIAMFFSGNTSSLPPEYDDTTEGETVSPGGVTAGGSAS